MKKRTWLREAGVYLLMYGIPLAILFPWSGWRPDAQFVANLKTRAVDFTIGHYEGAGFAGDRADMPFRELRPCGTAGSRLLRAGRRQDRISQCEISIASAAARHEGADRMVCAIAGRRAHGGAISGSASAGSGVSGRAVVSVCRYMQDSGRRGRIGGRQGVSEIGRASHPERRSGFTRLQEACGTCIRPIETSVSRGARPEVPASRSKCYYGTGRERAGFERRPEGTGSAPTGTRDRRIGGRDQSDGPADREGRDCDYDRR